MVGLLLYKLPRELLFMILDDCTTSGCPEFMGASLVLEKDGQAIIPQRGVQRLRLGTGHFLDMARDNVGMPNVRSSAIQNYF